MIIVLENVNASIDKKLPYLDERSCFFYGNAYFDCLITLKSFLNLKIKVLKIENTVMRLESF